MYDMGKATLPVTHMRQCGLLSTEYNLFIFRLIHPKKDN